MSSVAHAGSPLSAIGPLHIACAADEKYLPHCAAMLDSVFSTTREAEIVIHFTHFPEFSREQLSLLSQFVRRAGAELNPLCVDRELLATLPSTKALPPVVWQRVLLPELLPEHDKVLYLDSDLIFLGSAKPLWDLDVSDSYVAAVTNPMHEEMADWPVRIGLPDQAAYFNSGVMVMNLGLLREDGCARAIVRHAAEHPELIYWGDQCAMNAVLHVRRYPLHPKWNLMNNFVTYGRGEDLFPAGWLAEALADPQVVHFEGSPHSKPWHYRSKHPQRKVYLAHRQRTPWPLTKLEGRNVSNFVKKHLIPEPVRAWGRRWRQRGDLTGNRPSAPLG